MSTRRIVVKRCHGIGDVLMLAPVLLHLARHHHVTLITRPEWVETFAALLPQVAVTAQPHPGHVDLDAATAHLVPTEHRTVEYLRLLGIDSTTPLPTTRLIVPPGWSHPFQPNANRIGFAPEAGHPAREWPRSEANQLLRRLSPRGVVLLGLSNQVHYGPASHDLRGQLSLQQLFGVVSVLRAVLTLDSGLLHIAAAIGVPTLALFGGIDPAFRILPHHRVRALRADLPCSPCNKKETCNTLYPCMSSLRAQFVFHQLTRPLPHAREIVALPVAPARPGTSLPQATPRPVPGSLPAASLYPQPTAVHLPLG